MTPELQKPSRTTASDNAGWFRRLVSLKHVAACVIIINAIVLIMAMLGIVESETLAAALYWPWVTFVIVAMTSKPKANIRS